jgi:hypothetical protein
MVGPPVRACNPHATFTLDLGAGGSEIYKGQAPDGWRKPLPTDPTSAHWYDPDAFARLAGSLAAADDNRPIGEFIREFKGLSSTTKARQIAAAVPALRKVGDILVHPGDARTLLRHMQDRSTPPPHKALGQVPATCYEDMVDQLYGVDRFWYRHAGTVHDGVAWHIEVAVADTLNEGGTAFAVNYAPAFGDPLAEVWLETSQVWARGAESFLTQCDAVPDESNGRYRAAVVHVTCASPRFLDKGKTHLVVPPEVGQIFAAALWGAARELHREAEAAGREADREERRAEAARRRAEDDASKADRAQAAAERRAERDRRRADRAGRLTKRDAVMAVIPEAVRQQRGESDLPFSVHSLFYKIRPLALKLLPPGAKLRPEYVELTLIPESEREHGPIRGIYRDPRGTLREPHPGGRVIALGTRAVEAYLPPEWSYDKILVVEKEGLWPVIEAAALAERYDMAVVLSQGYAAEAVRLLLAKMPPGDVQIFALHDADIAGYTIGRMLGEATARMPDHHADVTDLGLTIDQAVAHGLESEEFTRSRAIPQTILPRLSPLAAEWFTGEVLHRDGKGQPKEWLCKRVELNAFTSPALIAFVQDGLRAHGADGKVVPPPQVLEAHARMRHEVAVTAEALQIIAEQIDADTIAALIAQETAERLDFTIDPAEIRVRLEQHREQPWGDVVGAEMAARRRSMDIRSRVTELLAERGIGTA